MTTADERRRLLEARYEAITWTSRRFTDGTWSPLPSKSLTRLDDTLTEWAVRLVMEASDAECDEADRCIEALNEIIRDRLIAFALEIEAARDARRTVAA